MSLLSPNGLVHLFVHLPIVTAHRCLNYGLAGDPFDFLMCTPDLAPVFVRRCRRCVTRGT